MRRWRYIVIMFEVLAFVLDNYWRSNACPEMSVLQRKLSVAGFGSAKIRNAMLWMEDLKSAARCQLCFGGPIVKQGPGQFGAYREIEVGKAQNLLTSTRIFTSREQNHLGAICWGYITFLISVGVLPGERLELVMDRVMSTPGCPFSLDDFKLIVLMVYWSLDEEPDTLVADELYGNTDEQLAC
jgi:Smg protein